MCKTWLNNVQETKFRILQSGKNVRGNGTFKEPCDFCGRENSLEHLIKLCPALTHLRNTYKQVDFEPREFLKVENMEIDKEVLRFVEKSVVQTSFNVEGLQEGAVLKVYSLRSSSIAQVRPVVFYII